MSKSERRKQPDPDPKKQAKDEQEAYDKYVKEVDKKRNVN